MQKFNSGDKVKQRKGVIVMTVKGYRIKQEKSNLNVLTGKYETIKNVLTSDVNCEWFDESSSSIKIDCFSELDLVLVNDK